LYLCQIIANASPLHCAANIAIIGIFQKTKLLNCYDNKRLGEVFGVSWSAVTKADLLINEQMKTQRRFKKETD